MRIGQILANGVVVLCVPVAAAGQEAAGCRVETVHGTARSISGEGMRSLEAETQVGMQDWIETEEDALVALVCPDDLRITIGPATVVELVSAGEDDANWSAMLPRGIARFARPLFADARFEVRTPSAVASVRSTEWVMDVADGATSVFVSDGEAEVSGREQSAVLAAGDGVDVASDGALSPVSQWDPARLEALNARLGPDGG